MSTAPASAMLSLKHIEVFHAIMRTGSITGAAQMLNVTQPAVSSTLKNFESRLRMQLFERVRGRLQPTPEAHALLPDILGIFERLSTLERLTRDLAGGRLGTLSIAATSPIANGYLAQAVAAFSRQRPEVRVALHSLASPVVIDRVVNREVDLGIAFEPVEHGALDVEVLTEASIACVLLDSHPLASQEAITLADLAPYKIITYLPQGMLRPHVDRALAAAGLTPRIGIEVGLSITGMMLAFHGAGVALVEPSLLPGMPLPGLVARPLAPRVELRSLLLRPRMAPASRVVSDFVALLQRTVAQGAAPSHKASLCVDPDF